MIPVRYITEWSEQAPWVENKFIEQDLIICRALVSIYSDAFLKEHLAFRGGTALGKLYLKPQPRYSEDIDLVQVKAEPIKETIDHLRDALAWLGEPVVKQKKHNNTDTDIILGAQVAYDPQVAWEKVHKELVSLLMKEK